MKDVRYRIVEHDGGWAYQVDGTYSGTFLSHDAAFGAARRAACKQLRPRRRDDRPGRPVRPQVDGGFRRLHPWPQHVGPVRGAWPDEPWNGWWGDDPPYHAPTFVLTHYPRARVEMQGGTTFHFVTEGIEYALRLAREAAGGKDVKIGGGAQTVRQYISAGHVDEIHLAFVPVALGQGEPLFRDIDLRGLGYRTVEHVPTERATHVVLAK